MAHTFNQKGYKERLYEKRRHSQRQVVPKPPPLSERITNWYNALPPSEQNRHYTMKELRTIFNETPQQIGATLFELGWSRKRLWRDETPTARYWFKHPLNNERTE